MKAGCQDPVNLKNGETNDKNERREKKSRCPVPRQRNRRPMLQTILIYPPGLVICKTDSHIVLALQSCRQIP